jgi:hypothetical protein
MPEIVWKQGAENDLLQIFAELEQHTEGAGVRFAGKLDFTRTRLAPTALSHREPGVTPQDS